jgi:hypothetical protein
MKEKQLTALDRLNNLAYQNKIEQHPTMPIKAVVKEKFTDKDTNSLTRCIMAFMKLKNHYIVRINTQGQVRGNIRTYSTTQKGTSDLHGIINSIHISIELKMKGDTQSKDQEETQRQVEKAGGIYLLIRSFEQFYKFYQEFNNLPY